MLNILRKRAQSIIIQVMVGLIAVVFIFWGVGTNLSGNRSSAAVVNGEEISLQQYQKSYQQAVDRYQQQFGGQMPKGFLENIGLSRQVLNQLIEAELLRQGASAVGLNVSREAVRRKVQEMEVFKVNGSFDLGKYKTILSQNRLTPKTFEASLQNDLMTTWMVKGIGSFAAVLPQEIQAWDAFYSSEIKIAWRSFSGEEFIDQVHVDEQELADWFKKKQADYVSEPQVKLDYYLYLFSEDMDEVHVSTAETSKYYTDNIDQYATPEKRHARHILLKLGQNNTAEQKKELEEKARIILAKAQKGEDFAALAQQYSEGPSKSSGGDLGFFTKGQMVPAFDKAVFSIQPGEVTGPVLTSFGYHIIKLEEIQPAVTRSLELVQDEIKKEIRKKKVRSLTFARASKAYEEIIRAGSLAKFSESGGAKANVTDFFMKSSPPQALANFSPLLKVVFDLHKGELSSLIDMDSGYAIAYVSDTKEPQVPDFNDVREQVIKDFSAAQSEKRAQKAAEDALAAATKAGSLSGQDGTKETTYLKRYSASGDVPQEVVSAAFSHSGSRVVGKKVIHAGNALYIYEVLDTRQKASEITREQEKRLADRLLATQQSQFVSAVVRHLTTDARIWINEQIMP
ncbi:MAG: hypothetical protein CSA32_03590 [Desulfobulbus propionicus]|nr:MAG: hypothetical protein CSA32_03590 [Desulfobulbus propionicus]